MKRVMYAFIVSVSCLIMLSSGAHLKEVVWESQGVESRERNPLWHVFKDFNPPEKPLVVIVTAYNVKNWYKANLSSLFAQKYSNYRVIYIDDCSTDGTPELVERFIQQAGQAHRVTLIKNKEWRSQMANHYTAAHTCDDNDIIINVDSDDWLTHEHVLALINKVYSYNSQVWLTYGNLEFYPSSDLKTQAIPETVLAQRQLRELHAHADTMIKWNWWHPRTFYAWLFKQVKLQDLLLDGDFRTISPSPDSAFMYPILEMASNHAVFIPDILYTWNLTNPLSQGHIDSKRQLEVNRIVASWPKYRAVKVPLQSPSVVYAKNRADIVIIADNAQNVALLLNDIRMHVKQSGKITVIYEKSSFDRKRYSKLAKQFIHIKFIAVDRSTIHTVLSNVIASAQEHIVVTQASQRIKKPVMLSDCIQELERTFAFGYYIGLGQDQQKLQAVLPVSVALAPWLHAWQFAYGQDAAKNMYSLDFVLYRRQDIQRELQKLTYTTLAEFIKHWYRLNKNTNAIERKVGLAIIE